jgi:hypothetical protein
MNADEKRQLIESLESSREEFLAALAGHSLESQSQRPSPESWSMLECAEHVILVENALRKRLAEAPRSGDGARRAEVEQRIRTAGPDRTSRRLSPAPVKPTGRFSALAEAAAQFNEARDLTVELVNSTGDLVLVSGSHPFFGPINGFEMVLFMCAHSLRHAQQIRETGARIASPAAG